MGALGYVMQVPEEEKYLNTKNGVRPTTQNGYRTVVNFLKKTRLEKNGLTRFGYWMPKNGL